MKKTIEEDTKYYTDKIICSKSNKEIEDVIYEILFNKRKYQLPKKISSIRKINIIDNNIEIKNENIRLKNKLDSVQFVYTLEEFKNTHEYSVLMDQLRELKEENYKEYEIKKVELDIQMKEFKEETNKNLRTIINRNEELFNECRRLYVENEKIKFSLKNND